MAGACPRHKARRAQGEFFPLLPKSVQVLKSVLLLCCVGQEQTPTPTQTKQPRNGGQPRQDEPPRRTNPTEPPRERKRTRKPSDPTPPKQGGNEDGRTERNRAERGQERQHPQQRTRAKRRATTAEPTKPTKAEPGRTPNQNPSKRGTQGADRQRKRTNATTTHRGQHANENRNEQTTTTRKTPPNKKIYAVWHYLQCTHCFLGTVVSFKQGRERSVYKPRLVREIRHTPSVASLSAKKGLCSFFCVGCRPVVWHNWRANGVNSFCQMIVSVSYRFCQMIVSVLSRF